MKTAFNWLANHPWINWKTAVISSALLLFVAYKIVELSVLNSTVPGVFSAPRQVTVVNDTGQPVRVSECVVGCQTDWYTPPLSPGSRRIEIAQPFASGGYFLITGPAGNGMGCVNSNASSGPGSVVRVSRIGACSGGGGFSFFPVQKLVILALVGSIVPVLVVTIIVLALSNTGPKKRPAYVPPTPFTFHSDG